MLNVSFLVHLFTWKILFILVLTSLGLQVCACGACVCAPLTHRPCNSLIASRMPKTNIFLSLDLGRRRQRNGLCLYPIAQLVDGGENGEHTVSDGDLYHHHGEYCTHWHFLVVNKTVNKSTLTYAKLTGVLTSELTDSRVSDFNWISYFIIASRHVDLSTLFMVLPPKHAYSEQKGQTGRHSTRRSIIFIVHTHLFIRNAKHNLFMFTMQPPLLSLVLQIFSADHITESIYNAVVEDSWLANIKQRNKHAKNFWRWSCKWPCNWPGRQSDEQ